ncbi:YheC/YheD family protein [Paenibacillus sp. N1-5-1-14]|uniref:YheC/YheD family endospore coat-associated protein n=1 Tax=Paenibacillus radicibacter TaxID=2972488 RepID=UPI00215990F5|nr:YheC/YheD family protein [Paenibacillus radicibacter]MCR8642063.1 YheC/YheD family protein [Paenibacillus radicibacter]
MTKLKVKITVQQTSTVSETTVAIGSQVISKLKLPSRGSIILQYGNTQTTVHILSIPKWNGLRLQPNLASNLGLLSGSQLSCVYRPSSNTLTIGPLIGVIIRRIKASDPENLLGNNSSFGREFAEACNLYGASMFFFTHDDIHLDQPYVSGWTYHEDQWRKSHFPIPNIIYNRLTSRSIESSTTVQQFMRDSKLNYDTQTFNEKYLNKNEVFDALKHEGILTHSLPESHLLLNSNMLKTMLAKYPSVFLKPIKGSLGKGIIRVRREGANTYHCHTVSMGGLRRQTYPTFAKLITAMSGKFKSASYQIQQGVDLIAVNGRPVDFRALVQRNSKGIWAITSIVARIAGNQTFVSNLARGGTLHNVESALSMSNLNPQQRSLVKVRLRKCALDVAKGIENQIQSHFAELGVDLAADTNGRVWLLEVNSKPSKEDNSPLNDHKIRPSVRRIIQYSKYLAKF